MTRIGQRDDDTAVVRPGTRDRISRARSSWGLGWGTTADFPLSDAQVILFVYGLVRRDAEVVADSYVADDVEWHYMRFADSKWRAIASDTTWDVKP